MLKKLFAQNHEDNYKLFFPFAVPGFFTGMGFWIWGVDYGNSRFWHPFVMMHLFVFPVLLGFLWTGIPRFVASRFPSTNTRILYIILLLSAWLAYVFGNVVAFKVILFVSHLGLLLWYFALMKHSKIQPVLIPAFLFYGFLAGTLGSGIILLSELAVLPELMILAGNELYRFVMFLFLVGAVGSKMLPVMAKTPPYSKGAFSIWSLRLAFDNRFWWGIGGIIFISCMFPVVLNRELFVLIRFAALLFLAREVWMLFRMPANRTMTVWFLKLAIFGIVISPFIHLAAGMRSSHASHAFFISMYLLLVMVVSSRVIFGHGGHDVDKKEKTSRLLFFAYMLVVIILILRPLSGYIIAQLLWYKIIAMIAIAGAILFLAEIGRTVLKGNR